MSFPAYDAIGRDIGLGHARWRVYRALQPPVLNFRKPVEIKLLWLAEQAGLTDKPTKRALEWLVERGYVIEAGRSSRGVRSLMLAWDIAEAA